MGKPSFYAVIPATVRYSDISANAKLLYGEITALATKEGFCWASNQYFADLYKVDKATISRWVSALNKAGFIGVEVIYREDQTPMRKLRIPHDEIVNTPPQKDQHINTTSNTSIKKTMVSSKEPTRASKEMVIELAQLIGTPKALPLPLRVNALRTRLKTFTYDQIKTACTNMAADDFLTGKSERNKKNYLTLDYVLRGDSNIDKYLNNETNASSDASEERLRKRWMSNQ